MLFSSSRVPMILSEFQAWTGTCKNMSKAHVWISHTSSSAHLFMERCERKIWKMPLPNTCTFLSKMLKYWIFLENWLNVVNLYLKHRLHSCSWFISTLWLSLRFTPSVWTSSLRRVGPGKTSGKTSTRSSYWRTINYWKKFQTVVNVHNTKYKM